MTEDTKGLLKELYEDIIANQKQAVETIEEYFGEELVENNLQKEFDRIMEIIGEVRFDYIVEEAEIKRISPTEKEYEELSGKRVTEVPVDILRNYSNNVKTIVRSLAGNIPVVIRFPEITVTNENDESVKVHDIFVKFVILPDGRLSHTDYLKFIRTKYSAEQYLSDYAHSHLPGIALSWSSFCFGSGPILNTISSLCNDFNADKWGLFCYELEKILQVESLEGVPYRFLNRIGRNWTVGSRVGCDCVNNSVTLSRDNREAVREFIKFYFMNNTVKMSFKNGMYTFGEPYDILWIKMSIAFSKWCNRIASMDRNPYASGIINIYNSIIQKYSIQNNMVFFSSSATNRISEAKRNNGRVIFKFKGVDQHLEITGLDDAVPSDIPLINHNLMSGIFTGILKVLNYKMAKNEQEREKDGPDKGVHYF